MIIILKYHYELRRRIFLEMSAKFHNYVQNELECFEI